MRVTDMFTKGKPYGSAAELTKYAAPKSMVAEYFKKKPKKRDSYTQRTAQQQKSEYLLSKLNSDNIARRIARGQKVSAAERRYLQENDAKKAVDASVANNRRKGAEYAVKNMRSKSRIKAYLDNARLCSASSGNDLVYEGYKELEQRYLKSGSMLPKIKPRRKLCTRG